MQESLWRLAATFSTDATRAPLLTATHFFGPFFATFLKTSGRPSSSTSSSLTIMKRFCPKVTERLGRL